MKVGLLEKAASPPDPISIISKRGRRRQRSEKQVWEYGAGASTASDPGRKRLLVCVRVERGEIQVTWR